jgi:ABC-type bacteriocin/lantibiotic exporter with double-glycine peptidase domain
MKKLHLPQFRQTYNYDCGATALQSILAYYGIEEREDRIIKIAKTTKDGTSIENIIKVIKKYGLKASSKKMTIEEVKKYIDKKIPVILVLQAWAHKKKVDWENNWEDGHYTVAIGYTKDKIIFEDPAHFNNTYLTYKELEKRWHDMDTKGKKYINHGIAVFGKKPEYKSDKIIHMD